MAAKGEQRRLETIDAFCGALLDTGIEMPSMDVIAAVAGTNRQSLRYHFGSKQDLIMACMEAIVTALQQNFEDSILDVGDTCTDEDVVRFLFQTDDTGTDPIKKLVNVAVTMTQTDTDLKLLVHSLFRGFEKALIQEVRATRSDASLDKVRETCFAIMSMSYGANSIASAGFTTRQTRFARKTGLRLLQGLGKKWACCV
jgi:AcrR family transcriptional regulator